MPVRILDPDFMAILSVYNSIQYSTRPSLKMGTSLFSFVLVFYIQIFKFFVTFHVRFIHRSIFKEERNGLAKKGISITEYGWSEIEGPPYFYHIPRIIR